MSLTHFTTDITEDHDDVESVDNATDTVSEPSAQSFDSSAESVVCDEAVRKCKMTQDALAELIHPLPEDVRVNVLVDDLKSGQRFSYKPDDSVTAASIYKIFVAYSELKGIMEHKLSWDMILLDEFPGDADNPPVAAQTLQSCFNAMIIYSDNACAEGYLNKYSPQMHTDISSLGINNSFSQPESFVTTASDIAILLEKLYHDEILTPELRSVWLDAMERQTYRAGIPSGISEDEGRVADKVGFLSTVLNDAGICYTRKGDFIIIILTDNSSWGDIAKLTQSIYDLL
jgi:beta-lactamase class A